jgi:hypothetical protein
VHRTAYSQRGCEGQDFSVCRFDPEGSNLYGDGPLSEVSRDGAMGEADQCSLDYQIGSQQQRHPLPATAKVIPGGIGSGVVQAYPAGVGFRRGARPVVASLQGSANPVENTEPGRGDRGGLPQGQPLDPPTAVGTL